MRGAFVAAVLTTGLFGCERAAPANAERVDEAAAAVAEGPNLPVPIEAGAAAAERVLGLARRSCFAEDAQRVVERLAETESWTLLAAAALKEVGDTRGWATELAGEPVQIGLSKGSRNVTCRIRFHDADPASLNARLTKEELIGEPLGGFDFVQVMPEKARTDRMVNLMWAHSTGRSWRAVNYTFDPSNRTRDARWQELEVSAPR